MEIFDPVLGAHCHNCIACFAKGLHNKPVLKDRLIDIQYRHAIFLRKARLNLPGIEYYIEKHCNDSSRIILLERLDNLFIAEALQHVKCLCIFNGV